MILSSCVRRNLKSSTFRCGSHFLCATNSLTRSFSLHSQNNSKCFSKPTSFSLEFSISRSNPFIKRLYSDDVQVVNLPTLGDSIVEGTLSKWHKGPGEFCEMDELVCSIETEKIEQEMRAPEDLTIKDALVEEGATVAVGADLYTYTKGGSATKGKHQDKKEPENEEPKKIEQENTASQGEKSSGSPQPSSYRTPSIQFTHGQGKNVIGAPPPPPPPPPTKPAKQTESPLESGPSSSINSRHEYKKPMSRMRQRIAQRLKDSQNTSAMLTTFQECDMGNLMEMRNKFKDEFLKKHGVKFGFMSAFVKASAIALKQSPIINAVIDGDEVLYRDYVDISVAVGTAKGLVVPVLRNCENMSFADIEKEINNFRVKADTGKMAIEDMTGGTFTISNGGVYGSMMGTPIINPPQSAILGMHAITDRPMVVNGEIKIRPIMYLALTYDHRLIDGSDAVTFLRKIRFNIEDPRRMLIDL